MQTIEIPQDTEITIEWLKENATRPEGWAYTEAVIRPNSYGRAPLPREEGKPGDTYLVCMGGWVRYLFHDGGVIEVEYINGNGVSREMFVEGRGQGSVFTESGRYAVACDPADLARSWGAEGSVKEGCLQVVVHRPGSVDLPEAIVRTIVYGQDPRDIHEQEIITSDGTWRTIRRNGEVLGSSYTPAATYAPDEPLRQY